MHSGKRLVSRVPRYADHIISVCEFSSMVNSS